MESQWWEKIARRMQCNVILIQELTSVENSPSSWRGRYSQGRVAPLSTSTIYLLQNASLNQKLINQNRTVNIFLNAQFHTRELDCDWPYRSKISGAGRVSRRISERVFTLFRISAFRYVILLPYYSTYFVYNVQSIHSQLSFQDNFWRTIPYEQRMPIAPKLLN